MRWWKWSFISTLKTFFVIFNIELSQDCNSLFQLCVRWKGSVVVACLRRQAYITVIWDVLNHCAHITQNILVSWCHCWNHKVSNCPGYCKQSAVWFEQCYTKVRIVSCSSNSGNCSISTPPEAHHHLSLACWCSPAGAALAIPMCVCHHHRFSFISRTF